MNFRHLGVEDGLSESLVNCIMQDSKGFMWIGTRNGLDKYDGYTFKHYQVTPFDSNGLQSNIITAICEDSNGTMWIGTQDGGLNSLDRKTGKTQLFKNDPSNSSSLSSGDVQSFYVDEKKRLWISTSSGLNLFNPLKKSFRRFTFQSSVSINSNLKSSIFEDEQHNIIFHDGAEIFILDPQSNSYKRLPILQQVPYYGNFYKIGSEWLTPISEDNKSLQLNTIDVHTGILKNTYGEIDLKIFSNTYSIAKLDSVRLLIGCTNGLFMLYLNSKRFEEIKINVYDPFNSASKRGKCFAFDRTGNLWIGTENGVYMHENKSSLFSKYVLKHPDFQFSQTIRSLYCNKSDELFCGSQNGYIYKWDSKKRTFGFNSTLVTDNTKNFNHPINGFLEDEKNRYWIAVTNGPCYVAEQNFNNIIRAGLPSDSTEISVGRNGYSLYEDHSGNIWLGTSTFLSTSTSTQGKNTNSFLKYEPKGNIAKAFKCPNMADQSNEKQVVCSFLEDRNGTFWIATDKGLFIFDRVTEKFTSFRYDLRNPNSISSNSVWVIHEDKFGNLWFGTWGGGLNLYNKDKNTFTHFTEKDGLPSNVIQSILEDTNGNLWIATSHGISHFNTSNKTFTNYTSKEGLLDDQYQPNAAAMLPDGEMFFGGNNGVTSFLPDKISTSDLHLPLAITSFQVLHKQLFNELEDGDVVNLSYDQNYFSCDFASLDFTNPMNKRYAYKLEGLDQEWIETGTINSAAYNDVPPGSYTLMIKRKADFEAEKDQVISVRIVISPPFWRTWWFYSGIILLTISFISFGVRRRSNKKKEFDALVENARENERLNIAGELHDGPLQDLYASRFIVESPKSEFDRPVIVSLLKKSITELLSILSTIQMPQFEYGLSGEIRNAIERFSEQHSKIIIVSEITDLPYKIPMKVQENLFRIFRTILGNISKHAEATEVRISLVTNRDAVTLLIRDNGKGFQMPESLRDLGKGSHFGLLLAENYARGIGADIEIHSAPSEGTTITVRYQPRKGFNRSMRNRIS